MENKLLTVVIAYYNLRFFKETLDSLASQTDKDFCVFIGNDNSPEDPLNLIESYKGKLQVSYKKYNANFGGIDLTLQWKRCIDEVNTPYFMILGDDDMLSNNSVEEINKELKRNNQINVYRLSMLRINEEGKNITELMDYSDIDTSTDFIVKRAKNEVLSSLGEYVFSKKKYDKYGIVSFPKAFYSDNMMVLQYSDFGRVINIAQAISIIRVSKYSISGNEINNASINEAASKFYYNLVKKYINKFDETDIKYFLPYLLYGYKHKILPINIFDLLKLIIKYNGISIVTSILFKKVFND